MFTLNYLKAELTKLYENDPYIHIDVSLERPHVQLKNVRVKIVGIYRNIFQVEGERNGKKELFSLQYVDVKAGIIKIHEMQK